ncbi:hypothetical protein [Microcoleus vaginatus]|uniref:hypothetical protein n=1 Tax=Microcoleus vaginatus TaxID=119532 RepID=UPI0032A5DBEA
MEPIDFLIAWLVTGSSLLLISQLPIGVEIDSTPKAVISALHIYGMIQGGRGTVLCFR